MESIVFWEVFHLRINQFLESVCEQIKYKPIRKDIAKELENHLEESKENYIQQGMEENIAEEEAIKQMGEAIEIGKELNKVHKAKFDWRLLIIICILLCFGFLVVLIRIKNGLNGSVTQSNIGKYILFLIIGVTIGIAVYFMDYRKISKYSNILYLIATGIIIYALLFGIMVNGRPYIYIGPSITFAPEIIAVPLYIIAFVGFVNDFNKDNKLEKLISKYINIKVNINLLKSISLGLFSLFVLTLIPSMVSSFIVGMTYLIIGTVKIIQKKENRIKNLIKLWGTVTIIGLFLILLITGNAPYKWDRLTVAINPESDPEGGGWVAMNRKTIIESAKIFGEAENTSDAIDLFDEGTNFAFISVLAHYGWVASIIMVLAVIALSIKLILNAIKIKDFYGKLLIIGISSMFIMQSVFNIFMNMNLWLEANFNLPFISYGGANLIINIMCLALILSIYRRKNIIIENSNNTENLKQI